MPGWVWACSPLVGVAAATYAAHLWLDPHTLRGRWREIHPRRTDDEKE